MLVELKKVMMETLVRSHVMEEKEAEEQLFSEQYHSAFRCFLVKSVEF